MARDRSASAGFHRLCRRPHRFLESPGHVARREGYPRGGRRTGRRPLSGIRGSIRGGLTMQLGMIGLGRMGANMVRRLLKGGHECVVFDMSAKAVAELVKEKIGRASCREGV